MLRISHFYSDNCHMIKCLYSLNKTKNKFYTLINKKSKSIFGGSHGYRC